jgi:hypothetical protein
LARFEKDGILRGLSLDFAPKSDLEEAIQGLRLLRTPFYGAVAPD